MTNPAASARPAVALALPDGGFPRALWLLRRGVAVAVIALALANERGLVDWAAIEREAAGEPRLGAFEDPESRTMLIRLTALPAAIFALHLLASGLMAAAVSRRDRLLARWPRLPLALSVGAAVLAAIPIAAGAVLVAWPILLIGLALVACSGGAGVAALVRCLRWLVLFPLGAVVYLLANLDWDRLGVAITIGANPPYVVGLPVLLSVLLFASAELPGPRGRHAPPTPRWLGWPFALGLGAVGLGSVVALDRVSVDRIPGQGEGPLPDIAAHLVLVGVAAVYLLVVAIAAWADLTEARRAWSPRRLGAALPAARLASRCVVLLLPVAVGVWLALGAGYPAASVIRDRNGVPLQVYAANGGVNRLPAARADIPEFVYKAVESVEDFGAFSDPTHLPVSPVAMGRILVDAAAGGFGSSGGSSLAAQVCKDSSGRPLVEATQRLMAPLPEVPGLWRGGSVLATMGEKAGFEAACSWSYGVTNLYAGTEDRDPVTTWLNRVNFGQGAHGIRLAAWVYFGARLDQLTLVQAAMLVGLPQAPSRLDPWDNPAEVLERRQYVLDQMANRGFVTRSDAAQLGDEPLGVADAPFAPNDQPFDADFFVQEALGEAGRLGIGGFSTAGRSVVTTLDPGLQIAAEEAAAAAVEAEEDAGANDAAVVVLDPTTGEILAWHGGKRFGQVVDLVTDYPHEPGSAIKPLLFACALKLGVIDPDDPDDPDETLLDTERVGDRLGVANFDGSFQGEISAADALARSRNVPAAALVEKMGADRFAACLRDDFGVQTDLRPDIYDVRLGIGKAPLSLRELAAAYAILATGGRAVPPTALIQIDDRDGRERYGPSPGYDRRLPCDVTAWVRDALLPVGEGLDLPYGMAAKTGTTEAGSTVAGFAPDLVVVAWVGRVHPDGKPYAIDQDALGDGASAILRDIAAHHYAGSVVPEGAPCPGESRANELGLGLGLTPAPAQAGILAAAADSLATAAGGYPSPRARSNPTSNPATTPRTAPVASSPTRAPRPAPVPAPSRTPPAVSRRPRGPVRAAST